MNDSRDCNATKRPTKRIAWTMIIYNNETRELYLRCSNSSLKKVNDLPFETAFDSKKIQTNFLSIIIQPCVILKIYITQNANTGQQCLEYMTDVPRRPGLKVIAHITRGPDQYEKIRIVSNVVVVWRNLQKLTKIHC